MKRRISILERTEASMAHSSASAHHMPRAQALIRRTNLPGRPLSLAGLRNLLETWEERKRFRLKLEDMLITTPHLVADVGLTRKQVEAEIAKPFWRV
jgi:uncharacterized protein YjiS (DUF1127 family)